MVCHWPLRMGLLGHLLLTFLGNCLCEVVELSRLQSFYFEHTKCSFIQTTKSCKPIKICGDQAPSAPALASCRPGHGSRSAQALPYAWTDRDHLRPGLHGLGGRLDPGRPCGHQVEVALEPGRRADDQRPCIGAAEVGKV